MSALAHRYVLPLAGGCKGSVGWGDLNDGQVDTDRDRLRSRAAGCGLQALLSIENGGSRPLAAGTPFHVQHVVNGHIVGGSAYTIRLAGPKTVHQFVAPSMTGKTRLCRPSPNWNAKPKTAEPPARGKPVEDNEPNLTMRV
jgi:hypothetical protein